jgi:hypothetical protein
MNRKKDTTEKSTVTATTEYRIGKTIYIVTASPGAQAADTLDRKIEKLILKAVKQTGA